MKRLLPVLLISFLASSCGGPKTERDKFVGELMSRMTVEEKIGQLNLPTAGDIVTGSTGSSDIARKIREGKVGGLFNMKGGRKIAEIQKIAVEESRLGIPLIFGMDVIHGYKTVFPIPLGLAATWNEEAVERSARIAAEEASAEGINWTFSPMVDVCRDPRWGRIAEGFGEDPFLTGRMGAAMVRGYQGDDLAAANTVMACVKHFALYGASEAGRDYNTVDMSRVRMYNEYLPAYKAAVDAGAGSVMSSFNEIDGIPATGNRWLLTDLLRGEWGFGGFVVSDYTSIDEMTAHGMGDLRTVSAMALRAGLDMDMAGEGYLTTLLESLDRGDVTEKMIDDACRRILDAKYDLGLFDDPYRYCGHADNAEEIIYTPSNRAEARRAATESFVLLKNEGGLLPLQPSGTIAVVGPLADEGPNMAGTWSVAADLERISPVVDGIRRGAPRARIIYAQGSDLCYDAAMQEHSTMFGRTMKRDVRPPQAMIAEAVAAARRADVVVAVLGEASEMSGESSSRTDLGIPDVQRDLLKALHAVGKPVVLVLFTGRALTLEWEDANIPAILNVWYGGTETADAVADVVFGKVNPSGKLPVTFPRNVGQIPIYYNHKNTGRPLPEGKWFSKFTSNYLDVENSPLYPFGYGLSYTVFEYSGMELSGETMTADGAIEASVVLTNAGKYAGAETVQLYIRDIEGSNTRPVKELKGFRKVFLQPGESRKVSFTINAGMLAFYNDRLEFAAEPGMFEAMIGADSQTLRSAGFELK